MDGESGIYTLIVCLLLIACQDKSSPFNHLKEWFYDTECMMLAYIRKPQRWLELIESI